MCAFRDVYAIEIGNTVNSNTDYKGTVSSVLITEMSMLIEIRNTVNSLSFFNTDFKGTVSSRRIAMVPMLERQDIQITL